MRWQSGRRSTNIQDRRGQGASPLSAGGGVLVLMRLLPLLLRSKAGRYILGIGLVVVIGAKMLGIDVLPMLLGGGGSAVTSQRQISPEQAEMADFVAVVLGFTEDTWRQQFQAMGKTYREPTLVLFSGSVNSACGYAQAAMGPFYCPADQMVYIDLSFFQDLKSRHGAPGDFAQAYVIAHEVGHHVQTLLGISERVHSRRQKVSEEEGNELSVRQELQADCFAGLWGRTANEQQPQLLEEGDLEEALTAAAAIGDDRLQQQSRGYTVPESFTHGTSEQRVRWFRRGFQSGDVAACDTFSAAQL